MQVAALSCAGAGLTPIKLSEDTVAQTMQQGRDLLTSGGSFAAGTTEWPSLLKKLERERGLSYCT
jgi:hypothetical protein